MKKNLNITWFAFLLTAILILSFSTDVRAQFNLPVPHAVCASCGSDDPYSHKPSCEYYSAPDPEPEPEPEPVKPQPKPEKPKPQVQQQSPKPNVTFVPVTPQTQVKPQNTQHQSTSLRDYKPKTEEEIAREREHQRAWNGTWEKSWKDELGNSLKLVSLAEGKGIFNFTIDKWILSPRYQRIIVPGQESAVVQLMKDGTWQIKELIQRVPDDEAIELTAEEMFDENPYEVEFDEIKFVDGQPWVALNKKDQFGRDHWRVWKDNHWYDVEDYSYQKFEIYANRYSGKYDFVRQAQDGEWLLDLEGTGSLSGLSSVKRVDDRGLYIIGMDIDGKEKFQLVHNDALQGMLPTTFDRITSENGNYKVELDGRVGIFEIVQEKDGPAHADVIVPPDFNYAKIERVHISDVNRDSEYAVVGDGRGYAMYSIKYQMQMLPSLFSTEEVCDFETRLICSSQGKNEKVRNKYNDTFSSDGRGNFKDYCQGVANDCYRGLTVNMMTEKEARETLKEENLRNEYFQRQNKLYNRESKLGKYDKNLQAFLVETHWGNVLLSVPPEEADAVKSAWKYRNKLNVVEYSLDLDSSSKPILKSIDVKVGDKVYKNK